MRQPLNSVEGPMYCTAADSRAASAMVTGCYLVFVLQLCFYYLFVVFVFAMVVALECVPGSASPATA